MIESIVKELQNLTEIRKISAILLQMCNVSQHRTFKLRILENKTLVFMQTYASLKKQILGTERLELVC